MSVAARSASRVRGPDARGIADSGGVQIRWERHGDGPHTVMLLPTWSIVDARVWKHQVPFLARRFRVIVHDGRGTGGSGRPRGAERYTIESFAADALAVLDATDTATASLVALSCGALWAVTLAAEHPERVDQIAFIAPAVPLAPPGPERQGYPFDEPLDTDAGWARYNSHYWRRDYPGFLEFFASRCLTEPHSSKAHEDFVTWASDTTPELLADTVRGLGLPGPIPWPQRLPRIRCPTLVIHGDRDEVRPHAQGAALAQATGAELATLVGSGHLPNLRDPVAVNRLLGAFLGHRPAPREWIRGAARRTRVLYLSSPIGLGHVRRDVAIAAELRRRHPDLEIEWLAQHPVTALLEQAGERVHPASAELASESAHITSHSSEHRLRCFEAIRGMDEILVSNFTVFAEVARAEGYDLWIGDEAWELDHLLHENPEVKTAPYVWLTDFVGWLPTAEGGAREAALTADLNAEMIEQIARFPRVRDRAIFIGDPDDVVPGTFGPRLPSMRAWTERHFDFCGYVTPTRSLAPAARRALREELGHPADARTCVVTVGGSGVGEALLRRAIAAYPPARERIPDLHMLVVTGPRIDPRALDAPDGVEVRGFVPDLDRHLAACDVAVVQGGLATTMELTAAQRPFLYFPLEGHFEQRIHVEHRLRRHGAGRRMEFAAADPSAIADAIAQEIDREVHHRPVPPGAAAVAARIIGELL